ncbi:FtsX-like permease family protein [Streptomyces camelliae]|uniref:FtsX-like permease family protein n=1 Tax=Streptomyces camelliae TaxID=3004093 RepID=A0ABY7P7D2_9ACTN|nr:FtsX-like permease family protein [Streptomyces sp. HUAS 2-6]WBO66486.1 FtsX-like permease family protein [Streptomyces sp. HUAS 2-6]
MKELMLGLRLLFGTGRGNRARFALMAVGGSLGVCCLAIVLTVPGILAAQDARVAGRQPTAPREMSQSEANSLPLGLERVDPVDSKPLTRIFLAEGTRSVAPPPGLKTFPRPGQVFVSPGLHKLLRTTPELAQRLPGRETGVIGAQGLARPDELVAYVGTSRDQLHDGWHLSHFGMGYAPNPTLEPPTADVLRYTMLVIALLPLTVFISVCARLSAAERVRRLAALRLLGMSAKEVQRVNAAETVAAAAVGALLGLGEYWLLNQLLSRIGLPGFTWYPNDGALSGTTCAICLVGCPALAWFVGRASARKAAKSPLAVRRNAQPKPPSSWGLLPLAAGSGIAAGYCAIGASGHAPTYSATHALLIPAAAILIGGGLVTALPPVSRFLAQWIAASTRSLTLGLAMRRNEAEPGGTIRLAAGLVLLVFGASLVQGVLIELDRTAKPDSPAQSYDVSTERLTTAQQHALEQLPGTRAHFLLASSTGVSVSDTMPTPELVLATCAQLRAATAWVGDCADGKPLRLRDSAQTYETAVDAGVKLRFRLDDGHRAVTFRAPQQSVLYRDGRPMQMIDSGSILIPPSMLPHGTHPESAVLRLVSDSDPGTIRRVFDGIGRVAPTADVTTTGLNVAVLQESAIVKALLAVAMTLGLVIGLATFLVAAIDRAVERRPQVTALTLLGAKRSTLRAAQTAQVALPLAAGLLLAIVTGRMAESSYLIVGGGTVFWDTAGLPLLLTGTLCVIAVAALGSLPLVGRRIDPELIRRD